MTITTSTTTSSTANWLAPMLLRADAGLPKYLQLKQALARAIEDGSPAAGERVPTEEMLVGMSGFSLGTVQRALNLLVSDGLLLRRQGAGTFVNGDESRMQAPFQHCRFLDESSGETLPIYSHAKGRTRVSGNGPWSAHLGEGDQLCIERIFSIGNEFDVYTLAWLPADAFPRLEQMSLKELSGVNLKDLLAREYHRPATRFAEKLGIGALPPAACKALKLAAKTGGAVLEIAASDRRGDPVYFQALYIPPNRRKLVLGSY